MEFIRVVIEILDSIENREISSMIVDSIRDPQLSKLIRRSSRKPFTFASLPGILYFASMLPRITEDFLLRLHELPLKIRSVYPIDFGCKDSKLRTLSPIYNIYDPRDDEFWEKIIDELEERIIAFWGIEPKQRPRIEVRRYRKVTYKIPEPIEAFDVEFEIQGSKEYLCAGLLGGFGLNTHLGLGYVTYAQERQSRPWDL